MKVILKILFNSLLILFFLFNITYHIQASGKKEDPRPGKLIWATAQDLGSADAHMWSIFFDKCIHGFCIEGLIKDTGWNNYEPELAASWEISKDNLTYTFKLRQGVKFHSGDSFTASDVVWSINRLRSMQTGDLRNHINTLKNVTAVDEYTIKLEYSAPNPMMLYSIAHIRIYSEKQAQKDGVKFYEKFIGTGPWVYQEWKPGQYIRFEKNNNWWGKFVKDSPAVIEHRSIPEEPTRIAALLSGEVDVISRLSTDGIRQVENSKELHILKQPGFECVDIVMKNDTVPFNNAKLRQAMDLLIPRKEIVKKLVGAGIPATAWSQPFYPWFPEDLKDKVKPFDIEKARKLINESNYKGEPIRLITRKGRAPGDVEVCEYLSTLWKSEGLNLTVEILSDVAYLQRRSAGNYEMFMASWDFNSPTFYLYEKYPAHKVNRSNVDPTFKNMVDTLAVTPDWNKYVEQVKDIERYLYQDPAALHIFYVENIWGISNRVDTFETLGGDTYPAFEKSALSVNARIK